MTTSPYPLSLARRWSEEFTEFLCLTTALRELTLSRLAPRAIQKTMLLRAVSLTAMIEHLDGYDVRPDRLLESAEAEIWDRTMELAQSVRWLVPPAGVPADELIDDMVAMQAAWDRWTGFVRSLPAGFCLDCRSLRPGVEPDACIAECDGSGAVPTAIVG